VLLAADWVTISALATAGGTLILALATFASVRSANRAARVAERSLLVGLRPLLLPARLEDAPQKVAFQEGRHLVVPGGSATAEAEEQTVLLAAALRNVGSGTAVLHGWHFYPEIVTGSADHPAPDEFTRLSRDIYIAAGEVGFWQGSFRDPSSAAFAEAHETIAGRGEWTVDVLYGDAEGGQRMISRYAMFSREGGNWLISAGRHWYLEGAAPR
jgi:hypothetical protein